MTRDVLIVDDEAPIRESLAEILGDEGYEARLAHDSASALAAVEQRRPSLVLLDIWLQGSELDGLDILKALKTAHPHLPVLMMSGHGTVETAVQAMKDGAYDFIEKPFQIDRLLLLADRAIEAMRLRRENEELRLRAGTSDDLVGRSSRIREIRQIVERVAGANSRVLVTGPPGSGKEVVARMIHARSRRADGPFVVVNCANMLPERVEIELFGEEGSDDGPRKVGYFEQAHGGTLLLDEIADMPYATQGKIVRVLQEQIFERVGGNMRVEVDVRVIASATRDLTEEMALGHFREDLYYRLNVVPVSLPPLRERAEDIEPLAEFFMQRAAETSGQQTRRIGDDAVVALKRYAWPGNVRELRNVIERMLILAPGDPGMPIVAEMLPPEIGADAPKVVNWQANADIMSLPLRDARELFEREYLLAQVTRFGGNISQTASFVGMERSALHRKLKSLGVRSEDRQ